MKTNAYFTFLAVLLAYMTRLQAASKLWTMIDGSHVPSLSSEFSPRVIDWLFAHPKP
jgi:hypothetical protein